jgi:energy-coupling factor transporter ATP-binding protein EcfA2
VKEKSEQNSRLTSDPIQRLVIIGPTGSGKTTLANQLGEILSLPVTDLDTLHWKPDWQEASTEAFRASVAAVSAGDQWIISGNYSKAGSVRKSVETICVACWSRQVQNLPLSWDKPAKAVPGTPLVRFPQSSLRF